MADWPSRFYTAYERTFIGVIHDGMVKKGRTPPIRSWIKNSPDNQSLVVYIGDRYNPQSNLRFYFSKHDFENSHTFARLKVTDMMLKSIKLRWLLRL